MKSYQIYINVKNDLKIIVGKLGQFDFPKGDYVYTGSAKRNIDKRIERHLSSEKKLHWHIDFLLSDNNVEIVEVKKSCQEECSLNKGIDGKIIVLGFGSSDCKSGCGSHLKYISSA